MDDKAYILTWMCFDIDLCWIDSSSYETHKLLPFLSWSVIGWIFRSQATLGMKGVKEMKALLDILELDSSVYVRIQVKICDLSWEFFFNYNTNINPHYWQSPKVILTHFSSFPCGRNGEISGTTGIVMLQSLRLNDHNWTIHWKNQTLEPLYTAYEPLHHQ